MLADPKPARGTAKRARRRKNAGVKDSAYLAWLHLQRCLVHGCMMVPEAHHERTISRDDAVCVPLCHWHHRGPWGRHGLKSLGLFQERYGISIHASAMELRGRYLSEQGVKQ